jgi:hypothetical protein
MFCKAALLINILMLVSPSWAQEPGASKIEVSFGTGLSLPLRRSSPCVASIKNYTLGVGYNLTPRIGVTGEFMFPASQNEAHRAGAACGGNGLYAVAGNVVFRFPTKDRMGVYLIGGVGFYQRSSDLMSPRFSRKICARNRNNETPCANGALALEQVFVSQSSNAFGGAIGVGVAYKMPERRLQYFTEARFHYARHEHEPTRIVQIAFGFRW